MVIINYHWYNELENIFHKYMIITILECLECYIFEIFLKDGNIRS